MPAMTATAAEARASFSKIADRVNRTGLPITVFKNSKPWVTINPIEEASPVVSIDWDRIGVVKANPKTSHTILPAEWDDPEDDGLYDDPV